MASQPKVKPPSFKLPNLGKTEGIEQFDKELHHARPSSSSGYIFPWSHYQRAYNTNSYDPIHSRGKVSANMVNSLLEDIYQIELLEPAVFNLNTLLGWVTMIMSLLFGMVYLVWGVATAYYKYEISIDGDKRFIDKKVQNARLADVMIVAFLLMMGGSTMSIILVLKSKQAELCRLVKRKFQIKKVLARHQSTTFEGTQATLDISYLGGVITITLPEIPAENSQDSDEEEASLKTKEAVPALAAFDAKDVTLPGTNLAGSEGQNGPHAQHEVNESAQLLAPNHRDYEAGLQVPEEQPL